MKITVENDIMMMVLESTLDSLIKSTNVDVEEYIRWARVLIQLVYNTKDKTNCFKYSNQIKVLLQESVSSINPVPKSATGCVMDCSKILELWYRIDQRW